MIIDEKLLLEEKEKLTKEFNDLASKIKSVELNVGTMKANLNAINGAIQQTDNLLNKVKEQKNEKI
jgi:septal ring factor EnvC (AmiA/AmiB activator)